MLLRAAVVYILVHRGISSPLNARDGATIGSLSMRLNFTINCTTENFIFWILVKNEEIIIFVHGSHLVTKQCNRLEGLLQRSLLVLWHSQKENLVQNLQGSV